MSASSRFEIRCTPEIRELVDMVIAHEGDATFSQLFRRLVMARAREIGTGAMRRVLAGIERKAS